MNLTKLTAVITAICFVYTSVLAPAAQAAVSPGAPGGGGFQETLNGLMIPATVGRITGAKYYGSRKVVVNIQDLHCHPEVQRNISRILGELDEKYRLQAVYLEGGYGDIDTSWLAGLKEERLRKSVAEAMVSEGRLTGAEYYSVMRNKPHLLKGIEDEQMHKENLARLAEMLGKKGEYREKVKLLDRDMAFMEAKYFSSGNRRFNKAIKQYREGKLSAEKYYRLLGKYVEKINGDPDAYNSVFAIDMNKYPNIQGYLELQETGKRLDYKRVSRQLQGFVGVLKQRLPYGAYAYLLEKTENFSKLDKLYVALSKLRREYGFDLSRNYPDLENFLEYVEKGQDVNPIGMIREEKKLIEEIRIGFSRDISELEVSFAADFYGYFKDYLFNRLAADDYRYFTERIGKFREIWGKYTYVNRLKDMEGEFALLDEYYRVNAERNRVFLEKILAEGGTGEAAGRAAAGREDSVDEDIRKTMAALERSPEIAVVVTGGFHTEGLQALLDEKEVTYLSITPNVTQDTKTSGAVYEEFVKQQAKALSSGKEALTSRLNITGTFKTAGNTIRDTVNGYAQADFRHSDALALTVASCRQGMERFKPAAEVLWREAAQGRPAEIAAQFKELMTEMGVEGVEVAVDDRYITFTGGTEAKIDRKTGRFEDSGTAGQRAARGDLAAVAELAARDAELAADVTVFLAKWVALSGSLVGFRALVTDILLAGAKWAGERNLTVGEGLIYAIAHDEQLQGMIAEHEGISADELGKLDPVLQKIIAARAQQAGGAQTTIRPQKPGIKRIFMPVLVLLVLMGSLLFPAKALAQTAPAGTPAAVTATQAEIFGGTLHKEGERSLQAIVAEFKALIGGFRQPVETAVHWGPGGLVFDSEAAGDRVARLNAFIDAVEPDFPLEEISDEALRRYMGKYQRSYGEDWSIENAKKEIKKVVMLMWLVDQSGEGRTVLRSLKNDSALIYIDEMGEVSSVGATRDGVTKIILNEELSGNYFDEAAALSRVRLDLFDQGTDTIEALFKALNVTVSPEDLGALRSPSALPVLVLVGGISGAVALLVKAALISRRRSGASRRPTGRRAGSAAGPASRRTGASGKTAGQGERTASMKEVIRSAADRIDDYLRQTGGKPTSRMLETFELDMQRNVPYRMVSQRLRNLMDAEQYAFKPADFLGLVRDTLLRMELDPTVSNERLNRMIREHVESFIQKKLHDYLKVRYDAYARSRSEELDRLIRDLRSREYNDLKFSAGIYAGSMREIFVSLYDRIRGRVVSFNNTSIEKILLSGPEYIELILRALEDEGFDVRLEKEVNRILEQKWSARRAEREAARERERERQRQREQQRKRYASDGDRDGQEQRGRQDRDAGAGNTDGGASGGYQTWKNLETIPNFQLAGITNEMFDARKDEVIRQCIRAFLSFYLLLDDYRPQKYKGEWTPEKEAEIVRALKKCKTAADLNAIDVKYITIMYRLMAKEYHTDQRKGTELAKAEKIMPQVNNAYEFLTKGRDRSGGLIGKYAMLSMPEYNSRTKEIRFMGRHVETGETEEIVLGNVRIQDRSGLGNNIVGAGNNQTALGIAFWFMDEFEGETLVFDENRYGIHGIGTSCIIDGEERSVVGVSEQYANNKVAWFHEAAELMGALGELDAETIVQGLQDRSWYDAHVSKPGRRDLKLHYAIRALQREEYAGQDLDMTFEIKGRLSQDEVRRIIKSRGAPMGAVLREFRLQRIHVETREQEQALLDEIIGKESLLARERQEQARREEEDRKRRAQEEETEKRSIEQCIQAAEAAGTPELMWGTLAELQKFDKKLVAEGIAAQLLHMAGETGFVLRPEKHQMYSALIDRVVPVLGPESIGHILKTVLQANVSSSYYGEKAKNLANLLSSLIIAATRPGYNPRFLTAFGNDLVPAFKETFARRASVSRYLVAHVGHLDRYFDVDPDNRGTLYFKKDFHARIEEIRDWEHKKQLLRAYAEATFKQKKLQEWIRLLLLKDADGYLFDLLMGELRSGAVSGLARTEMISLLSFGWQDTVPGAEGRLEQIVDLISGAYEDTSDPGSREDLMAALAHLADKVDSEAVWNRIAAFVEDRNPPLFDRVTKLGGELKDADRAYEALQKDPAATKEQLAQAKETLHRIEREQEDAMAAMQRRIAILSAMARKSFEASGEGGVCDAVLRYLAEAAGNDRWDVNIAQEILSAMKPFLQGRHPAAIAMVVNRTVSGMSGDVRKNVADLFSRQLSPREVKDLLAGKNRTIPDRLKYLLLLMHYEDERLLTDVVKDNASAAIDIPFRIYAFNLLMTYYTAYKKRDKDGRETIGYDSDMINKYTALLGNDAEKYLRTATKDGESFKRMFEEIPLQNEEALVNNTAVLIYMQNKLHHLSGASFAKICGMIDETKIRSYWNNARADFTMGGRFFAKTGPGTYFLVIAHELMHDVLSMEYDYSSMGIAQGTVHELLADAYAEYLAEKMGLDFDAYKDRLRYADHFEHVSGDEFFSIEVHEGARAQQMIIRETLSSRNIPFETEKFIASAVKVISEGKDPFAFRNVPVDEMVALILSNYFRADAKVSVPGATGLSAFAYGGLGFSDIDEPREEEHRQKVLGHTEIARIVDQFLRELPIKALLPRNAGLYFRRLLQGRMVEAALWGVHLKELPLLLFTPPARFDGRHGAANAAREQAVRVMQRSFWAAMLPGLLLSLGGIFGLVPAALIFGVLGAGAAAGITISGILHVRYDMQAAMPVAFFVTRDPAALDAAQLDPDKRGYAPVVITSVSRMRGDARNTGIKVQGQDVWTGLDERGMLTVYVAGENEEFERNAAGVVNVLKGYGNLQGSGRAVRVLADTAGQALNASRAVVFDHTDSARLAGELQGTPVLSGELAVNAGYGAIVNVYHAEQWPREIAFERPWSDGFASAGDRLNNSLVLGMADLDAAGTAKIWSLKRKGAKVYLRYPGNNVEELADTVRAYGLDGAICPELGADANELAQAAGNPDLWVAGPHIRGETARKYAELDLSKDKGRLGSIKAYTVVKVTLGDGYTLEDVLALNRLPASCIIVFDGAGFKNDTDQPSRDFTLLATFGVNVLELLKIAPVSREEREEYERRVAYRLDMGTFEVPDDLEGDIAGILKGEFSGISGNAAFLEAVRLHMLGTRDEELKKKFLGAVAERMRARARLAALKPSKANGLADEELERLYGELLVREDTTAPADGDILTKLALFAAAHKAEEVYTEFAKTMASLKSGKDDPRAISTMIRLIELYAEPRFRVNMSREEITKTDQRSIRKILEAA